MGINFALNVKKFHRKKTLLECCKGPKKHKKILLFFCFFDEGHPFFLSFYGKKIHRKKPHLECCKWPKKHKKIL